MDGSALIALGILLEEMCKEKLGDTGDLAFVEGEEEDYASARRETTASDANEVDPQSTEVADPLDQDEGESPQRRKRRRIRRNFDP